MRIARLASIAILLSVQAACGSGAGKSPGSPGVTSATSVAAGQYHSCALADGVLCWGKNLHGQLGNSSTSDSHLPVQVQGLTSAVQAIAAGAEHTCAFVGGGIRCWGSNGDGQLGNGSTTDSHLPVQVQGLTSAVQAITAGGAHSCAIAGGGLQCWGWNSYGQLGNNQLGNTSTTDSHVPVQATGLTSVQAIAIGAAGIHGCALLNGGVIACWGNNGNGQLGNDSTTDSHFPTAVLYLMGSAAGVAAGGQHSCALVNGSVECWGYDSNGQLGNDSTTDSHLPVAVQ